MRLRQHGTCLPEAELHFQVKERVRSVITTRYAVDHPKGTFATGRAEDSLLVHTHVAHSATWV